MPAAPSSTSTAGSRYRKKRPPPWRACEVRGSASASWLGSANKRMSAAFVIPPWYKATDRSTPSSERHACSHTRLTALVAANVEGPTLNCRMQATRSALESTSAVTASRRRRLASHVCTWGSNFTTASCILHDACTRSFKTTPRTHNKRHLQGL
eukprot:scaffold111086_cov75-Phaeocystis_antarctica.AAC.1